MTALRVKYVNFFIKVSILLNIICMYFTFENNLVKIGIKVVINALLYYL